MTVDRPSWTPRAEPVVGGFADLLYTDGRPRMSTPSDRGRVPRGEPGAGRFASGERRPEAATEQTGRFSAADVEELRLRVEASEQREREREIETRVRAETRSNAWPVATVLVVLILALAAAGCVALALYVAHGGAL